MEFVLIITAVTHITALRLRRKNVKLRAEQESQVVATLTHARNDVTNNGKQLVNNQYVG